jgi:hemoglobin
MSIEDQNCHSGKVNSFTQIQQTPSTSEQKRFGGGEEIHVVEAMIDIIFPPVPFPSNKIYKTLGEEKIREMVEYQHNLLLKTNLKTLFPAHPEALKLAIDKSADFFVEMLGGENIFTSQHGEPHLRMRHFKVPISENDREIWLAMYKKTLKDLDFPQELLEEFWNWIEPLSIRMINRRTNMNAIKRHHFHTLKDELLQGNK